MILYAQIGGLKAMVYSDAIQGTILLVVLWLISTTCIIKLGGIGNMFEQVKIANEKLLSCPGPNGLFSWQFLVGSMLAIVLIPVSQPQLTTRLVVMKDLRSMKRMAFAVGTFALVIIAATIFIGMYGAVHYPDASAQHFWARSLLYDQLAPIAGLAVVGLFAACLSTTNAQVFALGNELRSLLPRQEKPVMRTTKIALFFFAVLVLIFSIKMSDQLALLARVSFTGTSMMSPIILSAVILKRKPGKELIVISFIGLIIFLGSQAGIVPPKIGALNIDIALYIYIFVATAIALIISGRRKEEGSR